jgi:two-component system sensor histidine kinase KdpD
MRSYRDGGQFVLEVADEGEGIPSGEVESVFDKFYRAQKSDHVRPGTGLGLAISRGFIEAMHGRIFASNRRDRSGAVLTIHLPIPAGRKLLDTAA